MRYPIAALTITVALAALTTPTLAAYTECSVIKQTQLAIRPDGPTEPRHQIVNKGDEVAFRNKYKDWWFVIHYVEDTATMDGYRKADVTGSTDRPIFFSSQS